MKKGIKESGFTLLELLVVIVILGILATVGFGQYRTSQIKGRDSQRKSDLGNIARALEMYYNDFRSYPLSDAGRIAVEGPGLTWGVHDFATEDVIYMKILPNDPSAISDSGSGAVYCYQSSDGSDFILFAQLENENDPDCQESYTCNGDDYCYLVTSSNIRPTPNP